MTTTNKTILVFGATGQQGSATVSHLRQNGWQVRAFTRDPSSAAAQELKQLGAELAAGDMDDRASIDAAMQGVYGVFSVQPPDWNPGEASYEGELRKGIQIAAAAKDAGVRHLVYSSVNGAEQQSRFRPMAKCEIEQYIRNNGVPATILRPSGFMENYLDRRSGIQNGTFTEATRADKPVKLITVDDIGAFAAIAFRNPETFIGKTIEIAGDALTPPQIAAAISQAIGRSIPYVPVSLEAIRSQNETLARIYEWLNEEGYEVDFAALREWHPGLTDFAAWLKKRGAAGIQKLFRE